MTLSGIRHKNDILLFSSILTYYFTVYILVLQASVTRRLPMIMSLIRPLRLRCRLTIIFFEFWNQLNANLWAVKTASMKDNKYPFAVGVSQVTAGMMCDTFLRSLRCYEKNKEELLENFLICIVVHFSKTKSVVGLCAPSAVVRPD